MTTWTKVEDAPRRRGISRDTVAIVLASPAVIGVLSHYSGASFGSLLLLALAAWGSAAAIVRLSR